MPQEILELEKLIEEVKSEKNQVVNLRLDSCQHNRRADGFGDIVGDTEIKAVCLAFRVRAGGEKNDWDASSIAIPFQ